MSLMDSGGFAIMRRPDLDNIERDNLTVKVILMPVHEGPSEYEEEGEQ